MTAPADLAAAEPWLPLPVDVSSSDGAHGARLAAAAYVRRVRPDLFGLAADGVTALTPDPVAHADVVQAGQLVAARLWARRGSPTGLASFGEFGPGAIRSVDPDVERLLGIGRSAAPVVG